MFVDVELSVSLPPAVTVPTDAVLHSGLRKISFLSKRVTGFFEPRQVETGWRMETASKFCNGLKPGRGLSSLATFLLTRKARLQSAAQGIYGAVSIDPVCGMEVDEVRAKSPGKKQLVQRKTYFFCAAECKEQFDKDPGQFSEKLPAYRRMQLEPTQAPAMINRIVDFSVRNRLIIFFHRWPPAGRLLLAGWSIEKVPLDAIA